MEAMDVEDDVIIKSNHITGDRSHSGYQRSESSVTHTGSSSPPLVSNIIICPCCYRTSTVSEKAVCPGQYEVSQCPFHIGDESSIEETYDEVDKYVERALSDFEFPGCYICCHSGNNPAKVRHRHTKEDLATLIYKRMKDCSYWEILKTNCRKSREEMEEFDKIMPIDFGKRSQFRHGKFRSRIRGLFDTKLSSYFEGMEVEVRQNTGIWERGVIQSVNKEVGVCDIIMVNGEMQRRVKNDAIMLNTIANKMKRELFTLFVRLNDFRKEDFIMPSYENRIRQIEEEEEKGAVRVQYMAPDFSWRKGLLLHLNSSNKGENKENRDHNIDSSNEDESPSEIWRLMPLVDCFEPDTVESLAPLHVKSFNVRLDDGRYLLPHEFSTIRAGQRLAVFTDLLAPDVFGWYDGNYSMKFINGVKRGVVIFELSNFTSTFIINKDSQIMVPCDKIVSFGQRYKTMHCTLSFTVKHLCGTFTTERSVKFDDENIYMGSVYRYVTSLLNLTDRNQFTCFLCELDAHGYPIRRTALNLSPNLLLTYSQLSTPFHTIVVEEAAHFMTDIIDGIEIESARIHLPSCCTCSSCCGTTTGVLKEYEMEEVIEVDEVEEEEEDEGRRGDNPIAQHVDQVNKALVGTFEALQSRPASEPERGMHSVNVKPATASATTGAAPAAKYAYQVGVKNPSRLYVSKEEMSIIVYLLTLHGFSFWSLIYKEFKALSKPPLRHSILQIRQVIVSLVASLLSSKYCNRNLPQCTIFSSYLSPDDPDATTVFNSETHQPFRFDEILTEFRIAAWVLQKKNVEPKFRPDLFLNAASSVTRNKSRDFICKICSSYRTHDEDDFAIHTQDHLFAFIVAAGERECGR